MLVCLACPKQAYLPPTHDDDHHHTTLVKSSGTALGPSKESIKSFTSQLKDIVMKFSSGAYRHCRPCTAAAAGRGGVVDEDPILYAFSNDDKSSIHVGSNSEEQAMSDHHSHHNGMSAAQEDDESAGTSGHLDGAGSSASPSRSRYDLLPVTRCNRLRRHKKKGISMSSASSATLTLKQLPCKPDSYEAIEQLLDAHFLREERILAEERSCASRRVDEDLLAVDNRADHHLLEEAELVCKELGVEEKVGEEQREGGAGTVDGDVHVSRGKRHGKGESSGGKFEEWVAQVEPGVIITFVSLHDGINHLKRIRFSRELFSKWQAQLWWAENNQMVKELYSVSKCAPPFKSCESARSSSSTSSSSASSSLHRHGLRNTPELQSRAGSCESSPIQTVTVGINTAEKTTCSDRQASTSCAPHLPMERTAHSDHQASTSSMSHSPMEKTACSDPQATTSHVSHLSSPPPLSGGFSHEIVGHHENPLYDGPEFELCYSEGVSDSLINQRDVWMNDGGRHSTEPQDGREEVDSNPLAPGLVRELKRVKFLRQIPQTSN